MTPPKEYFPIIEKIVRNHGGIWISDDAGVELPAAMETVAERHPRFFSPKVIQVEPGR